MKYNVLIIIIAIAMLSVVNGLFPDCKAGFKANDLNCNLEALPDALSAFKRAYSDNCKKEISKHACYLECVKNAETQNSHFVYEIFQSQCYLKNSNRTRIARIYLADLLDQSFCTNIHLNYLMVDFLPHINSSELCSSICLTYYGHKAYGFNKQIVGLPRCVCFKNVSNDFDFEQHNRKQAFNQYYNQDLFYDVHYTQHFERENTIRLNYSPQPINETRTFYEKLVKQDFSQITDNEKEMFSQNVNLKDLEDVRLPKIVFFFTVNLRTYRHIIRLMKTLYDEHHFYYIHVDERSTYLKKKLKLTIDEQIDLNDVKNIKLADWSISAIWAGSSLLTLHLKAMEDLIKFKKSNEWDWDYLINLSEADFLIKSVEDFTLFLSRFKNNENIISFADRESPKSDLILTQGVEWHFVECDYYMWKVSMRRLPLGIQLDGAGDWFCFHSEFVEYLTSSDERYFINLREFFNHSLLAAEMFYHTVLMNSEFCDRIANIDIRIVNFQKASDRACSCDRNVDWCGCSPNYYNYEDKEMFDSLDDKSIFFARKFDPTQKMKIINYLDQKANGIYEKEFKSLNSYWLNIYQSGFESLFKFDLKFRFLISAFQSDRDLALYFKDQTNSVDYFEILNIHSYFYDGKFQGYILHGNIGLNARDKKDYELEIEAFFQIKSENEKLKTILEVIDEKKYSNDTAKCYSAHYNSFLKYFRDIMVSTDLDLRELRSDNHANLVDENSNPFLLINFEKTLNKNLKFKIEWIDSNGKIMMQSDWNLPIGFYEHGQFVYQFLNKDNIELLNEGYWQIRVIVEYEEENKLIKENVFLIYKFFVISYLENSKKRLLKDWKLKSACLLKNNSKKLDLIHIKSCRVAAPWSSFYPDPKSDFMYGLKNENRW